MVQLVNLMMFNRTDQPCLQIIDEKGMSESGNLTNGVMDGTLLYCVIVSSILLGLAFLFLVGWCVVSWHRLCRTYTFFQNCGDAPDLNGTIEMQGMDAGAVGGVRPRDDNRPRGTGLSLTPRAGSVPRNIGP